MIEADAGYMPDDDPFITKELDEAFDFVESRLNELAEQWAMVADVTPEAPLRGQPHAEQPATVSDEMHTMDEELERLRQLRLDAYQVDNVRTNGYMVVLENGVRYIEIAPCHDNCEVEGGSDG